MFRKLNIIDFIFELPVFDYKRYDSQRVHSHQYLQRCSIAPSRDEECDQIWTKAVSAFQKSPSGWNEIKNSGFCFGLSLKVVTFLMALFCHLTMGSSHSWLLTLNFLAVSKQKSQACQLSTWVHKCHSCCHQPSFCPWTKTSIYLRTNL